MREVNNRFSVGVGMPLKFDNTKGNAKIAFGSYQILHRRNISLWDSQCLIRPTGISTYEFAVKCDVVKRFCEVMTAWIFSLLKPLCAVGLYQ